tara:strand:+ start:482 stop:904 length:423 start_codon:yes stop_codon:yes gene_type:complete
MTIKQLIKAWTTNPTDHILELILDEIDWQAVLNDITNEAGGATFLEFYIDTEGVYWLEDANLRRETRYIGRLRCDKGDYDYLWSNYAHYNVDTDLYDTEDGESLTKQELRALCLEDGCFDQEYENMRNNLAHSAVHNLLA